MKKHPVSFGLDVSVSIRRENGEAFVDVHAPMYMNKQWTMPHSYNAGQFTDFAILNDSDFIRVMFNHFPNR